VVTPSGIEAFLAIARWRSISRAAEALFICQSSLSARLKNLEKELGTSLFIRKKGQREIFLTQSGKDFYEIALSYEEVMHRIEKMQGLHKTLNISSVNSLGAYIMPECYGLFMEKYPDVKLVIQDYEFPEACKSILQGNTDLAFNIDSNVPESIVSIPVFSERFILVCSQISDYPDIVRADMLNVKNEVYVNWYTGFVDFHTSVFGKNAPKVQLDIMAQLKIFVEKPNNWAIVPVSVARGLQKVSAIRTLQADFPLPERTVYCLHSKERQLEPLSTLFLQCLVQTLSRTEDIKRLLNTEQDSYTQDCSG